MTRRRANGRTHYRLNRPYYLAKARKRNLRTAKRVREWLLDYLAQHPCVDCGISDVRVLEFDHRDPGAKRAEISVLAATGYSSERDLQIGWWRGGEERARHDSNVQPFDP